MSVSVNLSYIRPRVSVSEHAGMATVRVGPAMDRTDILNAPREPGRATEMATYVRIFHFERFARKLN